MLVLMHVLLPVMLALAAAKGPAKAPPTPPTPPPPVCPEPAPLPPKPTTVRVMLPDLEAAGAYVESRQALTQIVAETAGLVRGYELLSSAEVRAVLDTEANKQLVGCSATSCLAELAEALDADLIVTGRVEPNADGAALVSLSLVNARAIVVVNRVNVAWRGPSDRLPDVVRTSAQLLLLEAAQRKPGALVVGGAPVGARVVVDGVDRTASMVAGRVSGLDVGVHEVNVDAEGMVPLTTWAIVQSEKDTAVDGTLSEVPTASVWWWVGGATAVVASAVATGALLYFAGDGDVAVSAAAPDVDVDHVEALRALGRK